MSFVLVVQYCPPSSNNRFYEDLKNILKGCLSRKEIILMGGFNINWEDKTNRKALKQITDNFDLTQLISGPTRITTSSQTQIDLIFSNRPERVVMSFNFITGLSDHNLTGKLSKKRFQSVSLPEQLRIPKSETENFKCAIQQTNWNDLLLGLNVEEDSNILTHEIQHIAHKCTKNIKGKKTKQKQRRSLPQLNSELLKLMRERDLVLKRALKSKLVNDKHNFFMLRTKITKEIRKTKTDFFHQYH